MSEIKILRQWNKQYHDYVGTLQIDNQTITVDHPLFLTDGTDVWMEFCIDNKCKTVKATLNNLNWDSVITCLKD